MAVLISRNCFSLLVVFLLFAAYPSAVRSKPTSSSLLDKDNLDYNLESTSTAKAGRFYHEFDPTKKPPLDEFKTTTKPVPTKSSKDFIEGTTEKVKIAKTSEELDSKLAGEKKSAGKKEKTTESDYPSEYESSESQEYGVGSDDVKKSNKKFTDNEDNSSAEDSVKAAKVNEISPNKKSKTRKPSTEQPEPAAEAAERLPSAEHQKSLPTVPTTTPLPSTTPASEPATGAAPSSVSWSRALVSFAVTVSTVYLLL